MKNDVMKVLVANVLYLFVSLIGSFLLPKFLSMDAYAYLKSYALYTSYASLLSIGYCDGMYIIYGGKSIHDMTGDHLAKNFMNFLYLEGFLLTLLLFTALILNNNMLLFFAAGMFFGNIIGYYRNLYQAIGEYALYGAALNLQNILVFVFDLVVIFVLKKRDSATMLIADRTLVYILVALFLTLHLNKQVHILKTGLFSIDEIRLNIGTGILLMFGNFTNSMFTSIDRWFIKLLFSSEAFALYSFAVSVDNIMNVFLSPIYITMYKSMCNEMSSEKLEKLKQYVLIWGFAIIAGLFPAKYIIVNYLPVYKNSLDVLLCLFASQVFYAIIKGIYVNLYKAQHSQRKYFSQTVIMTIIAILLNVILYYLFRSMISIAIATLITASVWFVICEIDDQLYRFPRKMYIYIIIMMCSFIMMGMVRNSFIGLLLYIFIAIICTFIFMRERVKEILVEIEKTIKKLVNRGKEV